MLRSHRPALLDRKSLAGALD